MDQFDQRVEVYRRLGMSPEAARIAAIGRHCTTEAEARAQLREGEVQLRAAAGGGATAAPATLAEGETRVYEAARAMLGMSVEQASRYAYERREAAIRAHGEAGARVYLTQLVESLGRLPR